MFHPGLQPFVAQPCSPPQHGQGQQLAIIDAVPMEVCQVTGLQCVTEAGWTYAKVKSTLSSFENQMRTEMPYEFWLAHPWEGVYASLAKKAVWNWQRCSKRRAGFQAMLSSYVAPPMPTPHMHPGMNDVGPWNFPLVPSMVFGQGNHNLEQPCGYGDDDGCSEWWPVVINPWVEAWSSIGGRRAPGCFWGMCVSLALTGGRPWAIHRTRIYVVTNHILGAAVAPAEPPEPIESSSSSTAGLPLRIEDSNCQSVAFLREGSVPPSRSSSSSSSSASEHVQFQDQCS